MTRVPIDQVISEIKRAVRRGDIVRAVPMVREFSRQAGADPRARLTQGMLALEFGQAAEAVRLLEQVTFELMGDDQRLATILLARARLLAGDPEGALLTIEPVCETDDAPGSAIGVKAEALVAAGRHDEAESLLAAAPAELTEPYALALARARLAFDTPPGDTNLARREDAAVESLTAEREHVGVPAAALADICLALAELKARRGDDAGAATLFRRSAALNPTQADVRPYAQTVMKLLQSWSDKALAKAQKNTDGEPADRQRPVFVVGMPGGGPELVSALLGAHPDVLVTNQQEALTHAVARFLVPKDQRGEPIVHDPGRISGKALRDAAAWYLERTDPDARRPARLVDPFPLNLHVLGVVAQLFPEARVVIVRRGPFDACLGCTARHRDPRLLYASDPRALAVFAGGLRRLEDLWTGVFAGEHLPLATLAVDYEDLATNPEAANGLFKFVGLDTPPADELTRALDDHTRWTTHQPGLEARFAQRMPELADAVAQAEIGPV